MRRMFLTSNNKPTILQRQVLKERLEEIKVGSVLGSEHRTGQESDLLYDDLPH